MNFLSKWKAVHINASSIMVITKNSPLLGGSMVRELTKANLIISKLSSILAAKYAKSNKGMDAIPVNVSPDEEKFLSSEWSEVHLCALTQYTFKGVFGRKGEEGGDLGTEQ